MDVAAVFTRIAELPVFRNRMEAAAEHPLTSLQCHRLSALVFLHDIGKLHPGFQAKGVGTGSLEKGVKVSSNGGLEFHLSSCNTIRPPILRDNARDT